MKARCLMLASLAALVVGMMAVSGVAQAHNDSSAFAEDNSNANAKNNSVAFALDNCTARANNGELDECP